MYILGLNQGHNSTATLVKDGKILECVSEERFTRVKNHYGFPHISIKRILENDNISMSDIDYVVLDDAYPIREEDFSVPEQIMKRAKHKSFTAKLKSFIGYHFPKMYPKLYDLASRLRTPKSTFQKELIERAQKHLKIDKKKILLANHHLLHASACCFNLDKNEKTLVFTLDGEGSDLSATVNIWDGKKMKTISKTSKYDSLGFVYQFATIHLGMKPMEHEFKVMGLAPYAKERYSEEVYQKMRKLFYIDKNLAFHSKYPTLFIDEYYKREMKYVRFDNFAAGVQKLIEELSLEWVKKAIKKTGIKSIALSGGVFMNVKAVKRIAELPEVEKIFIMPSCGDESNAIGAAFIGYKKYCEENGIALDQKPIEGLYLGPGYDNKYVEAMIKRDKLTKEYNITKSKNVNKDVAKLLAKGNIVARCSGNSEWGARALGNRSILAHPGNEDTIKVINELIKDRDFWMPFTPSMLDSFEKKYIKNPKNIFSPYMVIAYDSTEKAQKDLPAAIHPYDKTVRPQIVTKKFNKDYHEILTEFQKLTGIGSVLNTSFNLHGEPNVLTPEDAIHTVKNSGLKYLSVGDYIFEKK